MKKFVGWSVVAGVGYAILIVIFGLIFRVVDYRLTSFLFGIIIMVFWEVFGNRMIESNGTIRKVSGTKLFLLCLIMACVSAIITELLATVWAWEITSYPPSLGWSVLGCFLCFIASRIVDSLRKQRKTRIAEKQHKARVAELVDK